ncbi:Hypothetical_protein [Hexamita inflata]|uniref:Hypothetical_protein n=1 Tax=Hexamita inflata TaxID=28002 RepID=A0AA86UT13_9EUKA|nr:Hypothetical protein HINF_LOCUS36423 [Hexamita inflata]
MAQLNNINSTFSAQITQQKLEATSINNSFNTYKSQQAAVDLTQNSALQNNTGQITQLNSQISSYVNSLTNQINQLRTDMNNINQAQNVTIQNQNSNLQNQINSLSSRISTIQSASITVRAAQNGCSGNVVALCSGSVCGYMTRGTPSNVPYNQRACEGGNH